jgi:hypothetical protein
MLRFCRFRQSTLKSCMKKTTNSKRYKRLTEIWMKNWSKDKIRSKRLKSKLNPRISIIWHKLPSWSSRFRECKLIAIMKPINQMTYLLLKIWMIFRKSRLVIESIRQRQVSNHFSNRLRLPEDQQMLLLETGIRFMQKELSSTRALHNKISSKIRLKKSKKTFNQKYGPHNLNRNTKYFRLKKMYKLNVKFPVRSQKR